MSSLKKHSLIATIAITFSRIFGLIREQVFAFFFGASFVQDAFVAAFRIPNLLRDLFAEGALSQSFVTVFSQKLKHGDDKAYRLANTVVTFVFIILGLLTVSGIIFSPQIVHLIATGFGSEKFALTVTLNRVLFPFILFASLAAIFMGMLNAKNRFFLPQSASTFFNITSILSGLFFAHLMAPDYLFAIWSRRGEDIPLLIHATQVTKAITGMALGTLLGGVVQWFVQYPQLKKLGYKISFNVDFKNPDFIKILMLTLPAILGGAAVQINVMTNTYFASYLADGSVAWLNFAFRFMQFPLGVFGVAIATASAPKLAQLIDQGKTEDFRGTLSEALRFSLFLSIPSTFGLYFLADPTVSLIYEHGHFSPEDTRQTAMALMCYSLGIVSYSLIKIYQPAFLAFHDARTPMFISLFSIVSNLAINWYFVRVLHFPHWGLALGVSMVAMLNLSLLAILFERKIKNLWDKNVIISLFRTAIASFGMAATVITVHSWCARIALDTKLAQQLLLVLAPVTAGVAVYFGFALLMKQEEAHYFLSQFKRKISHR